MSSEWTTESVRVGNEDRETKYRDDVCGSLSKKGRYQDPSTWARWKDYTYYNQEWFKKNTNKIEFVNKSNSLYVNAWSDKYCEFNFRKPRFLFDRFNIKSKKYFYYSLFPIPTYLLIIFVINGFRKKRNR